MTNGNQLLFVTVHYPTIGPTYFQLYDSENKNKYLGRLLLSIETDPVDIDILKKPKMGAVPSLIEVILDSKKSFSILFKLFRNYSD